MKLEPGSDKNIITQKNHVWIFTRLFYIGMTGKIFNQQDQEQIESLHLTLDQVKGQIKLFEKGTAHINLVRPATIDDGIKSFPDGKKQRLARRFDSDPDHKRTIKFIPSSGAATRMFQIPLNFYNCPKKIGGGLDRERNDSNIEELFLREFLQGLREKKFAFYNDLQSALNKKKLDLDVLMSQGEIRTILKYLLTRSGLNYANLPKAFLNSTNTPTTREPPLKNTWLKPPAI